MLIRPTGILPKWENRLSVFGKKRYTPPMIVVRTDIPQAYFTAHTGVAGIAAAQGQYRAWLSIAKAARWTSPMQVKSSHPKASVLKNGRVVFNIKGNSYRLVCQINYQAGTVEIRFFGSHPEYDAINAETV